MSARPSPMPPGAQHKFVVDSAPEAANLIREQLGAEARVVAVRPVPRGGLGGLFRGPRLEVIAETPATPDPVAMVEEAPAPVAPKATAAVPQSFTPEAATVP